MGKNTFLNAGGPDPFEARVGTVLAGKWTLVRLIGCGGMAAVFEARHEIGRREAIKILHPEVARQEELRKRFEQEAYAVNQLHHPGVVQIRDVGTTDDGCPFLVMELEGASLTERVQERSLSSDEALQHIDALLAVLEVAHAAGIVHRDLKPDNLFVTRDGTLKVLDFGIARVRASGAMKVVTQTGTSLGTPSYMPPEQVKGVEIDHRADIFAVGAILWELLTGGDIHPASSHHELLVKMLTTPAPPLASVAPHVPQPICQVVDRALAFEAEDRYPSAQTMRSDLAEARAGRPPPFAIAAPVSILERATVARAPGQSSLPPTSDVSSSLLPASGVPVSHVPVDGVPMSHLPVSHVPASVGHASATPSAGDPSPGSTSAFGATSASTQLTGAPAMTAVTPPTRDDDGRKGLVAIIILGTIVGMLATVLVLRSGSGDESETADTDAEDDDEGSSRRPSEEEETTSRPSASASGASAPSASGSNAPDPAPVPSTSVNPSGPGPEPVDPVPVDPKPVDPEPPAPDPKTPDPVPPQPQPPDPKPVEPPPSPKPPPPPPRGGPKKSKKKKHDDDD